MCVCVPPHTADGFVSLCPAHLEAHGTDTPGELDGQSSSPRESWVGLGIFQRNQPCREQRGNQQRGHKSF